MTEKTELRIALFVDFENLVTNTGITPAAFDLQPAIDRLLERGKVVFRRAFCDWSRFHDAKRGLHELGFELVDVPPSTRAGKNGADIRLVIDALELCYAREHIDTFVIASGDSDFCPLAYKLRENDKRVIGLAVKEATSPFLVQACDEFIYLRPPGRASQPGSSEAPRRRKQSRGAERTDPATVPAIAREVVSNLLAQATGPINPSLIKQTIVRKEPDFDERDHGFSTFSKLLGALEAEGLLRLQQMGRQWYVLPPDAKDGKETEPDAKDSKDAEEPAPPQS
jgi:uncharacterized LabA/DUF88 family protein